MLNTLKKLFINVTNEIKDEKIRFKKKFHQRKLKQGMHFVNITKNCNRCTLLKLITLLLTQILVDHQKIITRLFYYKNIIFSFSCADASK